MKTIPLPHTPLQISQIAYGCMEIGGGWDDQPVSDTARQKGLAAVQAALEQGINFFDHADIYGRGKSEQVFGALLQQSPALRDKIIVQSKCGIIFADDPNPGAPHRFDFTYEHILASVEGSLRRLSTDYLDILLLHRPDPLVEPEEVARAFDDLQASGKVRFFGVSNHTAAQIELLQHFLEQPLIVNQVEMNVLHSQMLNAGIVFNQDFPPYPVRNEGTLEYCRLHDITLQAWAPLAGGIVTGKPVNNPSQAVREVSALVADLAREKNVSGEAILVAWLLRHPAHIQPIIGTTNPARIQAACQGAEIQLTREEWYRLFIAGRGADVP